MLSILSIKLQNKGKYKKLINRNLFYRFNFFSWRIFIFIVICCFSSNFVFILWNFYFCLRETFTFILWNFYFYLRICTITHSSMFLVDKQFWIYLRLSLKRSVFDQILNGDFENSVKNFDSEELVQASLFSKCKEIFINSIFISTYPIICLVD